MLLLDKIQLKNYLSHEDTEIELGEKESLLLDGASGAGKSSIMDAVIWALYGEGRVNNRSLIKRGQDKAEVTVHLSKGPNQYRVERSITQAGTHSLDVYVNDEPAEVSGIRDSEAYIAEEIIGCSYLLFINSIAYPQNNEEDFIKQNATTRKEILLEIIGASDFDKYYEMAKKKLRSLEDKLTVVDTKIEEREETISEGKEYDTDKEGLQDKLNALKVDKEKLEDKKEAVERKLKEYDNLATELKNLTKKKNEKNDELKRIQRKWKETKEKIDEIDNIDLESLKAELAELEPEEDKIEQLEKNKEKYEQWKSKRGDLLLEEPSEPQVSSKIENLEERLEDINKEHEECPGKSCDVCCEKYGASIQKQKDNIKSDIKELKDKQKKYEKEHSEHLTKLADHNEAKPDFDEDKLKTLKKQKRKYEKKQGELEVAKERKNRLDDLQETLDEVTEKGKKIRETKKELDKKKEKKQKEVDEKLTPMKKKKKEVDENLKEVQKSITSTEKEIAKVETMIENVKKAKQERKELKEEKSELMKKIDAVKTVKEAFSSNGIKSIMIDFVVPQLEDKMNDILQELSDFRIMLETQREKASGSGNKEGLFISIINGQDEVLDIGNYSGGEKVKINTAISEGLAELQDVGFRLWDENIINFDSETVNSFTSIMTTVEDRFSQLMCISHIQQVKDMFNSRVDIKKINGTSVINN